MTNDPARFESFREVFHKNLKERSRSAKGKTDTAVSDKKKKLDKDGADLEVQVRENTEALIYSVWDSANLETIDAVIIRALMEEWNIVINNGLQNSDVYLEERRKLEQEADQLAKKTGRQYRINRAYRVWDVPYGLKIPPIELELAMDRFYEDLTSRIGLALKGQILQAELLAYADKMSDSGIHAWADGCGRISTALVMWLSLLIPGFTLPVFGTRGKHYAAIQDPDVFVDYYTTCLTGTNF